MIAWAGWDRLQQAKALAEYYMDASQNRGWEADKLKPLLAGLADLLPWLKQWHNEFNAEIGMAFGDYIAGFLDEEARKQGVTIEALNSMRFSEAAPQAKRATISVAPKAPSVRQKTPEFASFAEAYPSSAADKLVCALALEIVAWREGISSNDHLDALILATHTELCRTLMEKGATSQLDTWAKPITAELRALQTNGLKWVQCISYLEEHRQALIIGRTQKGRPLTPGVKFDAVRKSFPSQHSGLATLVLGVLDSLNQERTKSKDLSQERATAMRTFEELHSRYALA